MQPALTEASIEDYVRLFHESFGDDDKLSPQYLRWQYCDNPHGTVIGFDAFHGNQLAAHYAIIPREYIRGDAIFHAALSVNTATHPAHQGKGLFVKLATATYEAAANAGVQFVVGAANANSIGGFTRKLGFRQLGRIRMRFGWNGGEAVPAQALGLRYSPAWLRWRLGNPSRRYGIVRHSDGTATLRTRVGHVPFNMARLPRDMVEAGLGGAAIATASRWLPALTPSFGLAGASGILLPDRLHPSPWHVIWKSLRREADDSLAEHLCFDGISTDTF